MPVLATWDPLDLPLGCNGHYGNSGANKHYRNGTPYCDDCRASAAHHAWVKRSERRKEPLSKNAARIEQQVAAIMDIRRAGEELVLGCNGKFGESGYNKHRRNGTTRCFKCRASRSQWLRFKKPPKAPRPRHECGTMRAVWQHRERRETLDAACKATENKYDRERKRRLRGSK